MNAQPTENIRIVCIQLMLELQTRGGSLTRLLPAAQARVAESERSQLQAWSYGFARYTRELEGLVDQLLSKSLKKKDLDIYLLLQFGIYQLRHTSMAEHAAVDESVKLVKRFKKPWAKGLVNAVLRNYQRRIEELEENLNDAQKYNHPQWLLERFRADWPEQWQAICAANNEQGPMTLRVNTQRQTAEAYKARLSEQGMLADCIDGAPEAIQLKQAVPVHQLPGFKDGDVSVQDAAAQMCAQKLMTYAPSGGRLLDACAAPGGKTAHILELQHFSEVIAIDQDADRLERVQETLDRLSLNQSVSLQAKDASLLDSWWDGKTFDAILLDAPCSGTGVIRRHPDIKLLRRPTDIPVLMSVQARLLDELWRTLSVNGVLLYATCSILQRENEEQVLSFLDRTPDASPATDFQQLLPGENGMDGFFYAPLIKGAQ